MEEGQVTVDGVSHPLPRPFIVIDTQNPTGAAGTQMLPDSQMDRFTIRMSLGYPDADSEVAMVMRRQDGNPMEKLQSLMAAEDLAVLQEEVASTFVHESVVRYIVALITATRENEYLLRGASPRATLSVTAMAKAVARLRDRDYVTPRDVQEVFLRTIGHRVLLSGLAENEGITVETVLEKILQEIPAPKAD
jgi:MoxR-like ATPase